MGETVKTLQQTSYTSAKLEFLQVTSSWNITNAFQQLLGLGSSSLQHAATLQYTTHASVPFLLAVGVASVTMR